jgi:hypothetical protein
MNKELKSLLILSLLTAPIGVPLAVADSPGSYGNQQASQAQPPAPAMGEYAGAERTQAAMGHYARARTLLVEAMREFDQGKEIARPDLILNSETWKSGVSARADELNHIISPQARETTGGTRFKENHSILNEKFDQPKKVASAPRLVKKAEKRQILVSAEKKESNTARARMTVDSDPLAVETVETKTKVTRDLEPIEPSEAPAAKKSEDEKDLNDLLAPPRNLPEADSDLTADSENTKSKEEKLSEDKAPTGDSGRTASPDTERAPEESETAKSINDDEIRARLKKLSEEIAQEEKSKK